MGAIRSLEKIKRNCCKPYTDKTDAIFKQAYHHLLDERLEMFTDIQETVIIDFLSDKFIIERNERNDKENNEIWRRLMFA